MSGIIDFHTHILPGMDDGSASVEESIEMLRCQKRQGINTVIATPHFYAHHDVAEQFFQRREQSWHCLREEMQVCEALPEVRIGAEVHFFRGMGDTDLLPQLAIEGTDYIMIEMPHKTWTDAMYGELEAIYANWGLAPIIAHMDRYIGRFRTYGIPERLAELPVLIQANSSFFLKRSAQALGMLKRSQIHLLGSDCHNLTDRSPNLGDAVDKIRKKLGDTALMQLEEFQNMVLKENNAQ